jgi:hypothetical protein
MFTSSHAYKDDYAVVQASCRLVLCLATEGYRLLYALSETKALISAKSHCIGADQGACAFYS